MQKSDRYLKKSSKE